MALTSRILSNRLIQPKKPMKPAGFFGNRPPNNYLNSGYTRPSTFTPTQSSASSIGATGSSQSGAASQQADPRDAQYFNDLAKLNQFHSTRAAQIQESLNEGQRQLTKNNQLLAEQQPKDMLAAKQNANKAGLLYSGTLGKNLGDIETSYARRKSDLQSSYASNRAGLLGQYNQNNVDYGLNQNDILLGSIGRQSALDQTLGVPLQQSSAPAASVTPKVPFRTEPGNGGTWHIYPGGRRVFVRKK